MAGATGLEPAASGVTGRRSNQLSYAPAGNAADLRRARRQVKASAEEARSLAVAGPAVIWVALTGG